MQNAGIDEVRARQRQAQVLVADDGEGVADENVATAPRRASS